jgi:hypothetical protein
MNWNYTVEYRSPGSQLDYRWPMAIKRRPESVREADLEPERALPLFRRQLTASEQLKGRKYDEASQNEQEWSHLTETLIERTFGNPSSTLSKWHMARAAGQHYLSPRGMPPLQLQKNFEARVQVFESLAQEHHR